jgi:hypothetical protein
MIKTTLVLGLVFLALGGWLLHVRIHPLTKYGENYIPFVLGIISALGVPILFWFRSTVAWAYVLNGFSVIIGTITMAHFSITHFEGPVTLENLIVKTLFADIGLLWGKFAIGKALFDLEILRSETDVAGQGRFLRYPNMGWWWVHLFALAAVYTLGNIFWK